jgi:secreted trypsin-like serine protease
VVDETEDEIRVRVGQHSLLESTPLLNVSKIIKHSQYDTTSQFNDIALLRLRNAVQFTKNIQPVCLPPSDLNDPKGLFAAGWGRIDEGGRTSDKLHHISLPQYSSAKCDAKFGGLFTDNHLCAGGVKGQDACQGDSGGPLTSRSRKRVELIGIVSWGIGLHLKQIINLSFECCVELYFPLKGCAREDSPGVYTRVTSYLKWIEKNTRDATYCLSLNTSTTNNVIDGPIQPNYDNCGLSNFNPTNRIVGRTESLPQEFPWIVIVL